MQKILSKDEYLYDGKIRNSFSLGQSVNAIRLREPGSRIGYVELANAASIDHSHCVYLSLCRARCDLLIVGIKGKQSKEFAFLLSNLSVVDYVTFVDEKRWQECCDEINPKVIFFEKRHADDLGGLIERWKSTVIEIIDHPFQYED